ncbi:glycosyltransferase, partial [Raoultella ornithinolytica]
YFNDNKNIYVILDALKLIKRNDFKISIIGDLSEKEPEKLEEALKDARVEYLGRVSDEKLVFLYSTSLAYIIPSRIEGFGIPALEAQKFGCPVISSNTGSLPEILKESAIFFNPEDPKELASLILMLLDSNANIIN